MNPNDAMVVVLKDILLGLLGCRFIYIVYISWYYIKDVSNVLLPPTCFWSACLSYLPVCQSNFNGWFRSQGKYRATPEFKSSGCAVSNNLNYDSSLSLSVSVKVIPKFLIQPSAIASDHVLGGNKWNCFKATQVLGCPTHILIWGSKIAKSPTR